MKFLFILDTVKSKDESQVAVVSQKMGLPFKTTLFCIIDSTVLSFLFETG